MLTCCILLAYLLGTLLIYSTACNMTRRQFHVKYYVKIRAEYSGWMKGEGEERGVMVYRRKRKKETLGKWITPLSSYNDR